MAWKSVEDAQHVYFMSLSSELFIDASQKGSSGSSNYMCMCVSCNIIKVNSTRIILPELFKFWIALCVKRCWHTLEHWHLSQKPMSKVTHLIIEGHLVEKQTAINFIGRKFRKSFKILVGRNGKEMLSVEMDRLAFMNSVLLVSFQVSAGWLPLWWGRHITHDACFIGCWIDNFSFICKNNEIQMQKFHMEGIQAPSSAQPKPSSRPHPTLNTTPNSNYSAVLLNSGRHSGPTNPTQVI